MNILRTVSEWALSTFGPGSSTSDILKLHEEVDEVAAEPHVVEEWADIIIAAITGAARSGHQWQDLEEALQRKVRINARRVWARQADGSYHHVGGHSLGEAQSACVHGSSMHGRCAECGLTWEAQDVRCEIIYGVLHAQLQPTPPGRHRASA